MFPFQKMEPIIYCSNNNIETIKQQLDKWPKLNIQGPPGTGKTWLMARLMAHETKAGVALTVTNSAAVNLFREIISQKIIKPHLILCPAQLANFREQYPVLAQATMERQTGKESHEDWGTNKVWKIGTMGHLGIKVEKEKGPVEVWIDESSTLEWDVFERLRSKGRRRVFGDEKQLPPFSGKMSVAQYCSADEQWGQVRLNVTHRLSSASITPVSRFYPYLKASNPMQGVKVGDQYLQGTILVPFETDSVLADTSKTTVFERRWVTQMQKAFKRQGIETLVTSPYRGCCDEMGGLTVNQIQGLTTEVLMLALTDREVNGFCCEPERLLVAITRATKLTMVVGRIDRLKMKISWFDQCDVIPPKKLLHICETKEIITF